MSHEIDTTEQFGLQFRLVFCEVADAAPLRAFYQELLHRPVRREMGQSWIEFGSNDNTFAIHDLAESNSSEPARMYLSYSTTDVAGLRAFLEANGTVCSSIHQRERGRYFTCSDPAGNRLHFIQFDDTWRERSGY